MPQDYLSLGSTPCEEPCAQVGSFNYLAQSRLESRAYINQLLRQHGEPPAGAMLRMKSFPHDFGTYHEVCVFYDPDNQQAVGYAFKLEGDLPMNWDEDAKKTLSEKVQVL